MELRPRREPLAPARDDGAACGDVGDTLMQCLERCIQRLEDPSLSPRWVVHEVRKDLKRARALLRLRGAVASTRALEKRCAAIARRLAPLRDVDAAGETVARLQLRADARQLEALATLAERIAQRHLADAGEPGLPRTVAAEVAAALRMVVHDLQALPLDRMDGAALDAGLAEAWFETALAFRRVVDKPVLRRFHAVRKAVKRELYQRELSGRPLDPLDHAALQTLAEILGELQDLVVLRNILRDSQRWHGPVRRLVKQTMRDLKGRAVRLGEERYPQSPS